MEPTQLEKQFLEAYDAYADKIFRHCLFRLRDREKAKELCQETFTRTWVYLSKGRKIEYMGAFLYRTATNLIIDESRVHHRTTSLDEMIEQGYEPSVKSEDYLFAADARQILRVVDELEPDYKEVILMRYLQDMSVKEISSTIGVTQVNASVRIHRALKKLRKLVVDKGTLKAKELL